MTTAKPNIVFLLTDDQRFDTIGALGNPHIQTPNMDRLAESGAVFTHAHIPGGTSGAVCMPSRAMIHTGRTLFHITDAGRRISADESLLCETFAAAGYRTFGTGKWHNEREGFHRSFTDGAEIFFGGMADHWNVPAYDFDPSGRYDVTLPLVHNPQGSNRLTQRLGDHVHAGRHSTDIIAEATARFVEEYEGDAPFFAYAAFLAPHDPRTMPDHYLKMYDPEKIVLPGNFMGGHPFDNGALHIRDEELAAFPRDPDETRRHIAEYYAMISHLDDRIGDVVEAVRKKGVLDNTIFILAGDNGLALGRHGLFGKQNLYEHGTRVPLIFSGPGIPRGVQTDALVYLLDIFATLCELTGVPAPGDVEGMSLVPVMDGACGRDALYLAYTDLQRGVRTERFKLIEYAVDGRHNMTQLFDLEADPLELDNLARNPSHAATLGDLREKLLNLRDEWDDCRSDWGRRFWSVVEGDM